jgi:hypothetical protein
MKQGGPGRENRPVKDPWALLPVGDQDHAGQTAGLHGTVVKVCNRIVKGPTPERAATARLRR